jgi:amidase
MIPHPFQTAHNLAAAIRAGQVSALEALEALIARIQQLNPALNAIVTLDIEGARRTAQEADAALRQGQVWGPLHGVPVTIKDSFETAGLRTTSGYPPFAERIPTEDAPPVARLRQAGAIVLGKTNLPALASGIQSNNPVFGRTNNPWDLARTPGGSSGGAAAAIAAGLSYLELGSDIGGSIRIPAHFCGVYGLKATGGRISGKGHLASPRRLVVPPGWEALLQLASFGPLARSIADLRLVLPILSEPSAPALEQPFPSTLADLRIAWSDDFGGAPLETATRRMLRGLADTLAQAGCKVARRDPEGFDFQEAWYVSGVCLGAINTLFQSPFTRWLRRLRAPLLSILGPRDALIQGLYSGLSMRPGRVLVALKQREALIDRLESFFDEWDAWVCPVFPGPAFTHRQPNAPIEVDAQQVTQLKANLLHSIIFNLSGHPVVTIPVGRSALGLPLGVQIVGRKWQEMRLLDVAEHIATLTPGFQSPPGY